MKKCPICDANCTHETSCEDIGLVEEYINCPNKCYSYGFSYGNTEIYIGDFMTGYSYTISKKDKRDIEGAIKVLINYYRSHKCK